MQPRPPPDNHVHTSGPGREAGSMEGSWRRAIELGLPSIAFTEHVDHTRWVLPEPAAARGGRSTGADGRFEPPVFDVDGYLECVERCRTRSPAGILSGVELGEPHWFADETDGLLSTGSFDRVLGSLHSLDVSGEPWVVDLLSTATRRRARCCPDSAFVPRGGAAHDRSIRGVRSARAHRLPDSLLAGEAPAFDPADFEEEFRAVLRSLAGSGRALEVNTVVPLRHEIVQWWYEEGGGAVSFGSDAHAPEVVARWLCRRRGDGRAQGFSAGRGPDDFWRRSYVQ